MKHRKGYILIESVITLSIVGILSSIIYSVVDLSINMKSNIPCSNIGITIDFIKTITF